MKRILLFIWALTIAQTGFSQTGTVGSPFTSLHQAAAVTSAGIYFFNFGGITFDTHVDANGYVQVAIDFGNGTGNLPQGTSLTNATRGILNTTILASLTETAEVRLSSSMGNFDVITTNATIISRIQSNSTLHQGFADNGINNDWVGTNAVYITANAVGTTVLGTSLHQNIVHVNANVSGTHWIPSNNQQTERFTNGEIANAEFLQLWVKGDAAVLPIELLYFDAKVINNKKVRLDWKTASEINNDYFTIERSKDGINWRSIVTINGAGNSSTVLNYSIIDEKPYSGISYYRLKQTDFDGQFEYSQIRSVNIEKLDNFSIDIYPNPSNNQITIVGSSSELGKITIYNALGQDVTFLTQKIENNETTVIINLTQLSAGIYHIKTKTTANKLYKQ